MIRDGRQQIQISIKDQRLDLISHKKVMASYSVSTALNGPGETEGSGCTPRGKHRIRIKIGAGSASGSVFVGRRPTGEIYDTDLSENNPDRDWILSRILWLTGLEPGKNRGGRVDTLRRYIYIHGTPDTEPMGLAKSHGCIRMRNSDVIDLFDRVENGDRVEIIE